MIHTRAINVVRNLLTSHDTDPRYTDADVRARVASLYLPLISIVIDALPQLYDPVAESRKRGADSLFDDDDSQQNISPNVANAISQTSVFNGGMAQGDFAEHNSYENHHRVS